MPRPTCPNALQPATSSTLPSFAWGPTPTRWSRAQHPHYVRGFAVSSGHQSRFDPAVSLFLELERELLAAGTDDAAAGQDVHEIGNDVIEQPLIMRDHDNRAVGTAQCVDTVRDDAKRVDVETRIG